MYIKLIINILQTNNHSILDTLYSLLQTKKTFHGGKTKKSDAEKLKYFENLLIQNPLLTDEEACQQIYGLKFKSSTYKSLKYRLEEKLMNEVFMMTADEFNLKSRVNAKLIVSKYYTIAQALLKTHQRDTAIYIIEKGLRVSLNYSYTDFTLIYLRLLINHYSFINPNIKRLKELHALKDEHSKIYDAEDYVQMCNASISHLYVMNKGGFNNAQLKEIKEMVLKMNEIKDQYSSNIIITYTYDLTFFYYSFVKDYPKCLEIATQALEINLASKINDAMGIYQSKRNLAISYFHLKRYGEANIWFLDILNILTTGSRNWIFSCSLYFLSLIGSKDFKPLSDITIEVLKNKNLSKFPIYEEQWMIREAYMHFLIRMGKIQLTEEESSKMRPFVLSRFLNSVPFYSKDKSGQNVTIVITQILFLMLDKKYTQVIDRIDTLTQYTYRYLRKDETFRSNCFIKMLLLATKADFHPIRTQAYTADLRKKLNSSDLVTDEKSTQIEIIPYDYLWELILEMLHNNK